MPERQNRGFSFFGMVAATMALLKLKERWDEYKQVPSEEEEGRIALNSNERDEEGARLLPQVVEVQLHPRPVKKRGCCICCGLDCTLFWKAVGIVIAVFTIWNAFKLVRWAVTPSPTGLETMPAFSTSLGCLKAPYIYNSSRLAVYVPMGTQGSDHGFDIHGNAVGTITIAAGEASSSSIKYEMTIRATERSLLDTISLSRPVELPDGTVENSRAVLGTPVFTDSASCVRYDITIYVPPTLKKLHVAAHTTTHIQFDPDSHINIDSLYVTAFAMSTDNMILPHDNLHAKQLSLEVYRGWIVGEAAIVDSTHITSQRGDGIINVKTIPTAPTDEINPETAYLQTTTGAGRTDIFYISPKSQSHRPINSVHMSSRNADMYITYREAEFDGRVDLDARSFSATGLSSFDGPGPRRPSNNDPNTLDLDLAGKARDDEKFTHYHGDSNGLDKLFIKTRGWAGVYF
ncbi:hypothetical protein EYR40_006654 [Pleurotus pulmonarius]|nr:hypothetical protein EYR36_011274 [Pleurotus pulmonarius]KAF4599560.1 hypothetical protein EYR40_006654 [Pleurotus pulmonarius]